MEDGLGCHRRRVCCSRPSVVFLPMNGSVFKKLLLRSSLRSGMVEAQSNDSNLKNRALIVLVRPYLFFSLPGPKYSAGCAELYFEPGCWKKCYPRAGPRRKGVSAIAKGVFAPPRSRRPGRPSPDRRTRLVDNASSMPSSMPGRVAWSCGDGAGAATAIMTAAATTATRWPPCRDKGYSCIG